MQYEETAGFENGKGKSQKCRELMKARIGKETHYTLEPVPTL
jgi:hypothetical protein